MAIGNTQVPDSAAAKNAPMWNGSNPVILVNVPSDIMPHSIIFQIIITVLNIIFGNMPEACDTV
jgi:hypothetical protein